MTTGKWDDGSAVWDQEFVVDLLRWAKTVRPDAYAATIPHAEAAWRGKFFARLVELRAADDPAWQQTVPLSILELTSLTTDLRTPDGTLIRVCGRKVEGRMWSFEEIRRLYVVGVERGGAAMTAAFDALHEARRSFDMVPVSRENP